MNISKRISIVILVSGLTVSVSSTADTNSDYMNIQNHWGMLMNEKDRSKRGPMIKEHRMMLDNFDKKFAKNNRQNGMQGNQMQGNQMQGNNMGGMSGNHMNGMSGEHMNMMNTINMHRSQMNMMDQ